MSDKVCCQQYEIDYKKVVEEIQETLYKKIEYYKVKLQEETNPIKYIEQKAMLDNSNNLLESIYRMFEYCKKPVEVRKVVLKEMLGE